MEEIRTQLQVLGCRPRHRLPPRRRRRRRPQRAATLGPGQRAQKLGLQPRREVLVVRDAAAAHAQVHGQREAQVGARLEGEQLGPAGGAAAGGQREVVLHELDEVADEFGDPVHAVVLRVHGHHDLNEGAVAAGGLAGAGGGEVRVEDVEGEGEGDVSYAGIGWGWISGMSKWQGQVDRGGGGGGGGLQRRYSRADG